jgi:ligand-binding SRPBCC domain-containing protein
MYGVLSGNDHPKRNRPGKPRENTHHLERSQRVEAPVEAAFDAYGDATNLEPMTPPWLHFHVRNPAGLVLREGTVLEYRLRLHGVPIRWRTLIKAWEPPFRFVDVQLDGPYALWKHTHEFEPDGDGATVVRDRVRYAIPFGPLGSLAHLLFVRRDLRRIFDFRRDALAEVLAGQAPAA